MTLTVDIERDTEATFVTPGGHPVSLRIRPATSDYNTLAACLDHDEYQLRRRSLTGNALDIGAHIGGVSIALAVDYSHLRVIAVEPLPENCAILLENLDRIGGLDVVLIQGAASNSAKPVKIAYGATDTEFAAQHEYIGNADWQKGSTARRVSVKAVSLSALVKEYGPFDFMKIDCEGGEWAFLDDPAISQVREIVGEFHTRNDYGVGRLHELLDPTHVLTVDDALDFGPFEAVRR